MGLLAVLAGAVLLGMASPAPAAYTLQLQTSDSLGTVVTVQVTGPFTGAGKISFSDDGTLFPEFSSLDIRVTSGQSPTSSFLNEVDIVGVVSSDFTTPNSRTVSLVGQGFTSPGPLVTGEQNISSSSFAGSFGSANLTSTAALFLARESSLL